MQDLTGQTAVITGASRGIGEATARHLADLGAHVVLAARSAGDVTRIADEIGETGGKATAVALDVADKDAVRAALDGAVADTGRLDLLVNNAGLIDPIARLDESDPDAWTQVVDVNLKGVYFGLHAALPHMLRQGRGTVVNISSGAATNALEGWSHYCATKAAVLSLTKCMDKEYREQGIRTIGLSPGTVATNMQVKIKSSGMNPVSQMNMSDHIPPEWVAQTIAFLLTPAADSYQGTDFSLKTNEGRKAVGLPTL